MHAVLSGIHQSGAVALIREVRGLFPELLCLSRLGRAGVKRFQICPSGWQ
jgi:hypothetical protein